MTCCTDNQFIHKGDWDNQTNYDTNNMVLYNGSSFIAIDDNCDVKPISKKGDCYWQLLALRGKCGPPGSDGDNHGCCDNLNSISNLNVDFNYKGAWKCSNIYCKGDMVTYKGSSYIAICNINVDNNDIYNTMSWRVVARGLNWRNGWTQNVKYSENDIVKHDGDTFICISGHSNGIEPDRSEKWDLLVESGDDGCCPEPDYIQHLGQWAKDILYHKNSIVRYNDTTFISLKKSCGRYPDEYDSCWAILAKDGKTGKNATITNNNDSKQVKYVGNWSRKMKYYQNNIVRHDNGSYIAVYDNHEREPTETSCFWGLLALDNQNVNDDCDCGESSNCAENYNEHSNKHNDIAKMLYAIIPKATPEDANNSLTDENDNICIYSSESIVQLHMFVCKHNDCYFNVIPTKNNCHDIKFNSPGYFRITYNLTYSSDHDFSIYTCYDGTSCIYAGENKGRSGSDCIINHTFIIGVDEEDLHKNLNLMYINKNPTSCNDTKTVMLTKKCWMSIEHIGN
jgi:hypothetical protein